jgi:hypothetical protein
MLKKTLAFGLLAAAMIIAPGVALAGGQHQSNEQYNTQEGAAINGSINEQTNSNYSNQSQVSDRTGVHGRRGYHCGGSGGGNQTQRSVQDNRQSGAAIDGSINSQDNSNNNSQSQRTRNYRSCYR